MSLRDASFSLAGCGEAGAVSWSVCVSPAINPLSEME